MSHHRLSCNLTHPTLLRLQFNTITSGGNEQPWGYIVSNTNDLLELFNADFDMLVIGEGAKILSPNKHRQEVLAIAEYLRLKHISTIQVSQAVTKDRAAGQPAFSITLTVRSPAQTGLV